MKVSKADGQISRTSYDKANICKTTIRGEKPTQR
jgi:hypothetical protein